MRFFKVLRHELNHIYLNRLNNNSGIPRWFSEGFSLKFANEITLYHRLKISELINNTEMFNMDFLDEKFNNKSKIDFDFAYAYSAVIDVDLFILYNIKIIAWDIHIFL